MSDPRQPFQPRRARRSVPSRRRPDSDALTTLLADPSTLREAQLLLLRDGALAYALHAYATTLAELTATLESLALPSPAPFLRLAEESRANTESLLRRSGVDAGLSATLSGPPRTAARNGR